MIPQSLPNPDKRCRQDPSPEPATAPPAPHLAARRAPKPNPKSSKTSGYLGHRHLLNVATVVQACLAMHLSTHSGTYPNSTSFSVRSSQPVYTSTHRMVRLASREGPAMSRQVRCMSL